VYPISEFCRHPIHERKVLQMILFNISTWFTNWIEQVFYWINFEHRRIGNSKYEYSITRIKIWSRIPCSLIWFVLMK